jgi:hypothetical protein
MAEEKLITIAQFASYIEAEMARQLLADYGIEAIATGENASNMYGLPAVELPELQVLESQALQARQILESQNAQHGLRQKQDTLEDDNDSEPQEGEDRFQTGQEQ